MPVENGLEVKAADTAGEGEISWGKSATGRDGGETQEQTAPPPPDPVAGVDKGAPASPIVNGKCSNPSGNGAEDAKDQPQPTKKSDGSASFLRAARAGNIEKVLEFLKNNTDINTCNANGLNSLHLASKEGHTNVVIALLERNANVDSATKKGNTALHIASLAGQDEIVKVLVEHSACVNSQSQNGFTPLYMAAQENHDSVVRFLLGHGANQSLATEDGFTPLAVALQQGHDRVVSVLLENDTRGKVRLPALHIAAKKDDTKAAALLLHTDHNPDITSKSGFTPLHIASHYGNDNIAALLIQRGADVNYVAKHQITPLHVASKWGKGNMVSLLVDKGSNIESKTRDGLTPLHCAARSGHETVVDMLLEKGAPITAKTKNGLAPLHMASQGDHVDAARILLYHKAPVDDVTVDFLTALHVAAHCGHVRVAKLLLDRKADPNSRALNGFTPLHIACKKNRIKVVELLLKHGASIEATTESGLTPLHVASFMGCMNIVIYLLQHGASADVPTVRGESPLHLAARANQTDIIRILLRNGAEVDAKAREQQTALHIASRLGNTDIVGLLLQQGASVDAPTKDQYTPLHIAAKEGQEEVAGVLLDHGANVNTPTKKGFTPLHLAAKYGHMKVARLLLQREAPVDPKGKNGVTPLHVAAHYDHQNVALLLLDKGAQPHATAKNGYTPLHIAARKNQMDIAGTLLEYGASANAESKAGFTPLHLSSQEGHTDMANLLLEHGAEPGGAAKNGLTPLHLCAQEDRVPVGAILIKGGATVDPKTKAGYTPLHVASHFGQMNMVKFLLQHGTEVDAPTQLGYTPLHQAAQQGHTQIVNHLLENKAQPNMETTDGKTALSIAQRLGYISVVETLKVVTETKVTTSTTTTTEEKYKVVVPETMHETFMSESEDEGGDDTMVPYGKPGQPHVNLPYYEGQFKYTTDDTMLGDQSYRYLTVDEMKSLGDDSLPIDVTRDEKMDVSFQSNAAPGEFISPQHKKELYGQYPIDNVDVGRAPILAGQSFQSFDVSDFLCTTGEEGIDPQWLVPGVKRFLVSFMVDARGGAMRGCRHSGVRVIIPPRKAAMPMRITCRYLKKDKLVHAPPLMEGEALASRILEMGPSAAKFLGPVIIEVPHFASLRGKEREIVILRSDNGETWREHTLEATEEAVQEVLNESFDGEELKQLEDLNTNRITRILTTDFPQYFAIVTRIRQEVHAIGPEGGMVSSTVVPQVQAVFPQGALTKKIKVGLQAQPIYPDLVARLLGNRVAVSPIVTVEPRRRKFHKPITLTIPVPQAASKGMINQYSGEAPTLRLLCSITGGTTRAQWEDVTGSTPLTFVNDCVSFTTTVSARFWLMDCTNIPEATKMATELYREAIHVPFMAKFVVFSKRHAAEEARVRTFCMTDDKEDKTLETQEHFVEVAKSRDVEVLEGKSQYLEFGGNLIPVTKSGDQLSFNFYAFRENRLPFTVRVKDQNAEPVGRVAFMRMAKVGRGDAPQNPICNLNLALPENIQPEPAPSEPDLLALEKKYAFLSISKADTIHKADLRLPDISNMLAGDWVMLAKELDISDSDINIIKSQYPNNIPQQAIVMLRLWMQISGNKATGNRLEKSLRAIQRDDIVDECICNLQEVTDHNEKAVAKERMEGARGPQLGEKDIMKDSESADEEDPRKIIQVSDREFGEEVRETPVVAEPRSTTTFTTSQVIVETVRKVPEEAVSVHEEKMSTEEIPYQHTEDVTEVVRERVQSEIIQEVYDDKSSLDSEEYDVRERDVTSAPIAESLIPEEYSYEDRKPLETEVRAVDQDRVLISDFEPKIVPESKEDIQEVASEPAVSDFEIVADSDVAINASIEPDIQEYQVKSSEERFSDGPQEPVVSVDEDVVIKTGESEFEIKDVLTKETIVEEEDKRYDLKYEPIIQTEEIDISQQEFVIKDLQDDVNKDELEEELSDFEMLEKPLSDDEISDLKEDSAPVETAKHFDSDHDNLIKPSISIEETEEPSVEEEKNEPSKVEEPEIEVRSERPVLEDEIKTLRQESIVEVSGESPEDVICETSSVQPSKIEEQEEVEPSQIEETKLEARSDSALDAVSESSAGLETVDELEEPPHEDEKELIQGEHDQRDSSPEPEIVEEFDSSIKFTHEKITLETMPQVVIPEDVNAKLEFRQEQTENVADVRIEPAEDTPRIEDNKLVHEEISSHLIEEPVIETETQVQMVYDKYETSSDEGLREQEQQKEEIEFDEKESMKSSIESNEPETETVIAKVQQPMEEQKPVEEFDIKSVPERENSPVDIEVEKTSQERVEERLSSSEESDDEVKEEPKLMPASPEVMEKRIEDGFVQPSAADPQMEQVVTKSVKSVPAGDFDDIKEQKLSDKETSEIESTAVTESKDGTKSPFGEADLAVLDSFVTSQKAEVEEMTFVQALAESKDLKDSKSDVVLAQQIVSCESRPDLPQKTGKGHKRPPPPLPPPRKMLPGVSQVSQGVYNAHTTSLNPAIVSQVTPRAPSPSQNTAGVCQIAPSAPASYYLNQTDRVSQVVFSGQETKYPSSDEGEDSLMLMRDSPKWEEEEIKADDTVDMRPIKAEIKLLVKTTELGKESIEIRSIREFMDPSDKAEPSNKIPLPQITEEISIPKKDRFESPTKSSSTSKFVRHSHQEGSSYEPSTDDFNLMTQVRDVINDNDQVE